MSKVTYKSLMKVDLKFTENSHRLIRSNFVLLDLELWLLLVNYFVSVGR